MFYFNYHPIRQLNQQYLTSEPLKILPRLFTISTNNTSAIFNTNILLNSSYILKDYHQKNPDKLQYHIEIEDNQNVLSKIEQIFQGEEVIINQDEYSIYNKIKKILSLIDLPSFSQNQTREHICIRKLLLDNITEKEFLTFTIKTNKSEYLCNIIGVTLSSVIQELLEKDPTIDHYNFDYEDENGEFEIIRDFFNFKSVSPKRRNVEAIKEIAEDLKIDSILKVIDDFVNPNKKLIDIIDEQQETIDENKEIFELLYNIKKITVISVADEIKKSQISKTEENVYDLAAYIIQVVKTDISLHQYMIELLIELNKGENQGQLKALLPFFVDRIMSLFCKKISLANSYNLIFPFVYKMYKNDLISKEELYKNLHLCDLSNSFFVSWFLPEILEANSEEYKIDLEPQSSNLKNGSDVSLTSKSENDDDVPLIAFIIPTPNSDINQREISYNFSQPTRDDIDKKKLQILPSNQYGMILIN